MRMGWSKIAIFAYCDRYSLCLSKVHISDQNNYVWLFIDIDTDDLE